MNKIPFYESNFSVPDIPQKILYSQRIRNLNVEKNRLSVLIAPAGFSKTTAVLLSLREHRAKIKWYRMNREDAVLQVWYSHLITSLFASRDLPAVCESESMSMLASITDIGENYPLLNAQIVQDAYALCDNSEERVYLVLDDFHYVVDNDIIVETVQYLVSNMPQCLSVIITSRRDPKIISGRLALRDDVRRITAGELLFTKEEAASLINDVYGLGADSSHIDAVFRRTEGWLAGLYIFCRSESICDEDMEAIAIGKKGEELFSLVLSKYLRDIDPKNRRIMIKLSVLEDFSCDELNSVMNVDDAEGFVRWLEGGNFYIQKIPTVPPRYRFHALFREELLKMFETSLTAEEKADCFEELGRYYREEDPRLAIRFFLMGGFENAALATARECSREFFDTGIPEKMFMLVGEFPQPVVASDPYLLLYNGMFHINSNSELALATFMKAIDGFRKKGDLSFLMNTFGMLLVMAYQHNDFVLLEKAYKRLPVISLLAAGGDTRKKLIISFFIAMTGQDRLNSARLLLKLLDRRKIRDDMWDFSYAMIRGIYFYRCGDLELSAANLDRIVSHPVCRRNDQWRIIGLVSCCNVSLLRMDFVLIQRFADEFFLLGEKYDSAFASGYGYFMLAYLKYGKCDIPGALKAIDDSIEAFSKYGGDLLVKESIIIRSLWNEREPDERTITELEYIRAALNEEKPGHGLQELAMTALGVTYKRMGRFDGGYVMLTEALASVKKIGAKQSICGLYLQLADLFLRKGDQNAAAEYAALFAELAEQGGYTYWREADISAVRSVYGLLPPECRMKPLFRKISNTYSCEPGADDAGAARKTAEVKCKLFGEFSVSCGGVRLCESDFKTRKVSGILKYILTLAKGDTVSRERLAAVFWPEANSKAAFASLRVALYELRRSLSSASMSFENENALIVERKEGFAVNPDILVERDTDLLEEMYRKYRKTAESCPDGEGLVAALGAVCDVYDGAFLQGQLYDDWADVLREHYVSIYFEALYRLAEMLISAGEFAEAEKRLMKGMQFEPLDEKCCKLIVDAYTKSGQQDRADHFLKKFSKHYMDEMGVELTFG